MVLGMVSTNCYLVYNDDTKEGVVVDPADNGAYILKRRQRSLIFSREKDWSAKESF